MDVAKIQVLIYTRTTFDICIVLQVRPPMFPVFFFLIDVSMNAVATGAAGAACSAVQRALADLPVKTFVFAFFMSIKVLLRLLLQLKYPLICFSRRFQV